LKKGIVMQSQNSPGLVARIGIAFSAFFRALFHAGFAQQILDIQLGKTITALSTPDRLAPSAPTPTPVEPPKPQIDPLQLVSILQREGRLIDFLMEDIQGLPDAQIGAAVREVHRKTAKALTDHVTFVPVVETLEDEKMTVPAGYDPSSIRVVGKLGAHPPYTGFVRHRGWKASELKLQPLPAGQNPHIITPAEIEVS
jgi:hypothetical protein